MKGQVHLIFLLLIISISLSYAQKKIKTLTVSDEVIYATVDRPGELYVVTRNGQIQKFDVNGNLLSVYKNNPAPTLFDPRDGARLFAYYRHDQHYSFLNPSFEVTAAYNIDSSFVIEPWLICVSGDHNLWILDAADQSIKKINVATSSVEAEITIPGDSPRQVSSFIFMREYQGFLFLLDSDRGILIFNSIGRWLKTISSKALPYFNFLGEELYYPEAGRIKFFNLFTAETREIPLLPPAKLMLITDERAFTIHSNTIEFFSLE